MQARIDMDTAVQLFDDHGRLSSIAVGDPAITLIENDSAFSILVADTAERAGVDDPGLHLNQVLLLRIKGKSWIMDEFQKVAVYRTPEGVWVAQDIISSSVFHEPSVVPYHVIFLSPLDHGQLLEKLRQSQPQAVFHFTQLHFGRLPGFDFSGNTLTTPDDYATACKAVDESLFYCPK
jgi:hypothetical protein